MSQPEKQGKTRRPSPLRYAGVGIELVAPVILGVLLGMWLDRRWETEPWCLLTGAMLGLVAGFLNFFREVAKITRRSE